MNRSRRWKARRRKTEQCETCGTRVRLAKAVVITEVWTEHDGYGLGGSGMTATFCASHDPRKVATP